VPHGAPPPNQAPAEDVTSFPPDDRVDSQVGVIAGVALNAGVSMPIPGIREDYGITEAIVGTTEGGPISIDYVPILCGTSSEHFDFQEPVITGQPHTVTNNGAGTVHVFLYAVAKQRRIHRHDHPSRDHETANGQAPADAH